MSALNSLIVLAMLATLPLAACNTTQSASPPAENTVMPGRVTDMPAFDRFIAGTPTPEQFRARYPNVVLALPGAITTKEFRTDNSRYFAKLDAQGRIVSGSFQ